MQKWLRTEGKSNKVASFWCKEQMQIHKTEGRTIILAIFQSPAVLSMLCSLWPPRSEMGSWSWSPWPDKWGRGKWSPWPAERASSTETCHGVLLWSDLQGALQAGAWRRWLVAVSWRLCLQCNSACRRSCWSCWFLENRGCFRHSTGHPISQGAQLLLGWGVDRWRYKKNIEESLEVCVSETSVH